MEHCQTILKYTWRSKRQKISYHVIEYLLLRSLIAHRSSGNSPGMISFICASAHCRTFAAVNPFAEIAIGSFAFRYAVPSTHRIIESVASTVVRVSAVALTAPDSTFPAAHCSENNGFYTAVCKFKVSATQLQQHLANLNRFLCHHTEGAVEEGKPFHFKKPLVFKLLLRPTRITLRLTYASLRFSQIVKLTFLGCPWIVLF